MTLKEQIEKSGIKELLRGFDDLMMYGEEIYHVDGEGNIKQISVMSKEGQEVLTKVINPWEPFEPEGKIRWMSKEEILKTYGHLLSKEELEYLKINEQDI